MRELSWAVIIALMIGWSGRASVTAAPPPQDAYSPARYGVPETLGGYQVLAVLAEDNSACLRAGERRLILQAPQPTIADLLGHDPNEPIRRELQKDHLAEFSHWGWDVVGPGQTREQVIGQIQQADRRFQAQGCIHLGGPLPAGPIMGGEIKLSSPYPGYAIIQDLDAGSFSDANAQSVFLVAPVIGLQQLTYTALLNNVLTDAIYFLQDGLVFNQDGTGQVVWADTSSGYLAQPFAVPYIAGDAYWTLITYSSGIWSMCVEYANHPSTYTCHAEPNAIGTHLQLDVNTSIFFENWNPNYNWARGFNPRFKASGAQIYRSGLGQNWSSQDTWTVNACATNWLPAGAIAGTLTGGQSAQFLKLGMPPYC